MGTWLQWNTSSSLIALCSMVCRHCGLNMEAGSPPSLPSLSQQAGEATSCFASSSRTEAPETGTMHIPPAESNFHKRWEAPVVQLHIRQGGGGGGIACIVSQPSSAQPLAPTPLWIKTCDLPDDAMAEQESALRFPIQQYLPWANGSPLGPALEAAQNAAPLPAMQKAGL